MTSGLMALISRRIDVLNRLVYVNQEIEQSVSLLKQEAWVLKTELAKAIHGSVQAKFLSLSLQFDSLKSVSKKQLAEASKEVKKVIDSVDDSFKAAAMTFEQQMELILAAWDKSVRIDLSLTNEIRDKIDAHPIARTCLVELIGEAVANAAKHNSSPRVSVEISSSEGSYLQVLVTSEGRLTRVDNSRKGYGSKMLNEVTSAWSLTSAKGRVYLHAAVPLAK
jgi:signal transduction histidine kinase